MDIEDLQSNWETFGRTIPMRSIVWRTEPWEAEEFFATGREGIAHSMSQLDALGVRPSGRALDFGCGIGRLTQALGEYFDEVVGVDIAASMIDQARNLNTLGDRCRYVVNVRDDLTQFDDATFDFVYSHIVLQHVGPDLARAYVAEFIRILRPGGIAMFQIPSQFISAEPLARSGFRARIESASPTPDSGSQRLTATTSATVPLRITNTSSERWLPAHRLAVGARWKQKERVGEDSCRTTIVDNVDKGGTIVVEAEFVAPSAPGAYDLEFDIVAEPVGWFADYGSSVLSVPVEVVGSGSSGGDSDPGNHDPAPPEESELTPQTEIRE